MVAANSVEDATRAGDAKDRTKRTDTNVNGESLLLRTLQYCHDVVSNPKLNAAHDKVNASDRYKRGNVVASGHYVADLLASGVIGSLGHSFPHLLNPELLEVACCKVNGFLLSRLLTVHACICHGYGDIVRLVIIFTFRC